MMGHSVIHQHGELTTTILCGCFTVILKRLNEDIQTLMRIDT